MEQPLTRQEVALQALSWARPPSIPALVFIIVAVVVPTALQTPVLNSDGDLARHLRHGSYMLEHAGLIRQDPFSFTRAGQQVVGFEYGSQLLYTLADRIGGLPAVAVLAGILIGTAYALLVSLLLRLRVDPLLAVITIGLAVVLGIGHWTARPHLVSYVAAVILLGLLEYRPRRLIPITAVLFLVWVNLHGGFLYGWTLIGLYLAGSVAEIILGEDRSAWQERARSYAFMLLVATLVSLINPHGIELHSYLFELLEKPFLFDNTAEFTSPNFHEPDAKVFLATLLLTMVGLALPSRRPSLPHLFVIGAGAAFALISVRNIPLFGLTALPLLAVHVDRTWRGLPDPGGFRDRFANTARRTSTLPWVLPVVALVSLLAVSKGRLGSQSIIADRFDSTIFPVTAVQRARTEGLQGRLFSEFTWGGYVAYAWPEQKIFIDGGADFFGDELFREYASIKGLLPGWRDLVEKWDLSLMLLQRESSLAHQLVREPRWEVWYCDSLAVLLKRGAAVQDVGSGRNPDLLEARLAACGSNQQGSSYRASGFRPTIH